MKLIRAGASRGAVGIFKNYLIVYFTLKRRPISNYATNSLHYKTKVLFHNHVKDSFVTKTVKSSRNKKDL